VKELGTLRAQTAHVCVSA